MRSLLHSSKLIYLYAIEVNNYRERNCGFSLRMTGLKLGNGGVDIRMNPYFRRTNKHPTGKSPAHKRDLDNAKQ
jgi:hypothetical protein